MAMPMIKYSAAVAILWESTASVRNGKITTITVIRPTIAPCSLRAVLTLRSRSKHAGARSQARARGRGVPARGQAGSGSGEDDFQSPRAVHALDAVEFDVAGRRRAADPGAGPAGFQALQGLRDDPDDLAGVQDAQVVVGDQAQRAAALARAAVQDNSPGLRDGHRGGGDHTVGGVERLG